MRVEESNLAFVSSLVVFRNPGSVVALRQRKKAVDPNISAFDLVAAFVELGHALGITVAVAHGFSVGSEIGSLDLIAVFIILKGTFGETLVYENKFSINS